jgi:hypothetical protein
MEKYKVLKLSKEGLENSIAGLSQIKPMLQQQCLVANLDGQGKEDAKELGEHFETAINAMITVLGFMESKDVENCENEKIECDLCKTAILCKDKIKMKNKINQNTINICKECYNTFFNKSDKQ